MSSRKTGISRRSFLKKSLSTAAVAGFPTIVPATVFGQYAPSKRINVGAIGVGRISRGHDMPLIMQYDQARIVAVCDLDAHRVEDGKKFVNGYYAKKTGKDYDGTVGYANYHELLANKDIDAVVVVEAAVLGVDQRRLQRLGDLRERDRLAILPEDRRDERLAVARVELGLLRRRTLDQVALGVEELVGEAFALQPRATHVGQQHPRAEHAGDDKRADQLDQGQRRMRVRSRTRHD